MGILKELEAEGFKQYPVGGNCEVMVRRRGKDTDVVSSMDGVSLPKADDWLLCVYPYDWCNDIGASEARDCMDSEQSSMDLISHVRL